MCQLSYLPLPQTAWSNGRGQWTCSFENCHSWHLISLPGQGSGSRSVDRPKNKADREKLRDDSLTNHSRRQVEAEPWPLEGSMAVCTRMSRGMWQRFFEHQRTYRESAGFRQYCKCFPNQSSVKLWDSFQNACLHGSEKQPCLRTKSRSFSDQKCGARGFPSEHFSSGLLKRETMFCQTLAYSTRPDRNRVKGLMIATYISAAIGGLLLLAVGSRFYGRFKKRARGVEEVDTPLFGRRSRVFCRYRGYIIHSNLVDTVVNDVPRFEVRPDDIWVVSFPKAGETWRQNNHTHSQNIRHLFFNFFF